MRVNIGKEKTGVRVFSMVKVRKLINVKGRETLSIPQSNKSLRSPWSLTILALDGRVPSNNGQFGRRRPPPPWRARSHLKLPSTYPLSIVDTTSFGSLPKCCGSSADFKPVSMTSALPGVDQSPNEPSNARFRYTLLGALEFAASNLTDDWIGMVLPSIVRGPLVVCAITSKAPPRPG